MKKVLVIVLAVLFSMAFVGVVFAQAPAPTEKVPAATEKAAPEKKMEKKEKAMHFRGEVTAVDAAAKTMTVKGKKGEETFDVSNAKGADKVKSGEKVKVMYKEVDGKKMASAVHMSKAAKKAEMKEMKSEKTEAPAAPAK